MNSANESMFLVMSDNTSVASSRKYQHKPHYKYGKSRMVKKLLKRMLLTKKNSKLQRKKTSVYTPTEHKHTANKPTENKPTSDEHTTHKPQHLNPEDIYIAYKPTVHKPLHLNLQPIYSQSIYP